MHWQTASILALLIGYAVLVYRTAWLSDDSFISLRTAANILDGYGPRWNVAERVQTYTHPLWLAALTAAHAVTGEPFYSSLHLSWLVSCLAVACLVFAGRTGGYPERLLGMGLLLCSRAFIDFSTSGLENPLTHLLLAAFALIWLDPRRSAERHWPLALLAGLAAISRLDTILLYAPALFAAIRHAPARRLAALAWTAGPVLAWELFSIFYYGFPFPNTAYAKLATGFAGDQRPLTYAGRYFWTTLIDDPLTLGAIALACLCAVYRRDRPRLWLLGGVALYLGYVVAIGGDFMGGRFFSAPFIVAIACLTSSRWLGWRGATAVAALSILAASLSIKPIPALTGASYGHVEALRAINPYGIHDQRAAFFQTCSLTNAHKLHPGRRDHPWTQQAHRLRAQAESDPAARVQLLEAVGLSGYYAGPRVHIIDRWALGDPLLARLPAIFGAIGHYTRVVPPGYLDTLRTGENLIQHPGLAAYYEQLRKVVRGELTSGDRWRAIWDFAVGRYDHAIDAYAFLRTREFRPRFRVVNTTRHPNVFVYAWNDSRQQSYWIDDASYLGKRYDLSWRVTPTGAVLEQPFGHVVRSMGAPAERGVIQFGVAFNAEEGAGMSLHELRYGFASSPRGFTVMREPWPTMNETFPTGLWQDYTNGGAIEPLSLIPLPSQ